MTIKHTDLSMLQYSALLAHVFVPAITADATNCIFKPNYTISKPTGTLLPKRTETQQH